MNTDFEKMMDNGDSFSNKQITEFFDRFDSEGGKILLVNSAK